MMHSTAHPTSPLQDFKEIFKSVFHSILPQLGLKPKNLAPSLILFLSLILPSNRLYFKIQLEWKHFSLSSLLLPYYSYLTSQISHLCYCYHLLTDFHFLLLFPCSILSTQQLESPFICVHQIKLSSAQNSAMASITLQGNTKILKIAYKPFNDLYPHLL